MVSHVKLAILATMAGGVSRAHPRTGRQKADLLRNGLAEGAVKEV